MPPEQVIDAKDRRILELEEEQRCEEGRDGLGSGGVHEGHLKELEDELHSARRRIVSQDKLLVVR